MRFRNSVLILIAILLCAGTVTFGQEDDVEVVDEVVVQVNESVILLSQIKSDVKNAIDALVQQGKPRDEAKAVIDGKMGQLIANLITEELLIQKGKEIGVEKTVEARINSQFLDQMKQFNLKSLDELYAAMRQQGFDPETIRDGWRRRFTQEEVWRSQVAGPTYWEATDREVKAYFEQNKAKFKKPATVTISEIFLSFAGRDKAAVRQRAIQLVSEIRGGADFVKLAKENSDRPNVQERGPGAGTFAIPSLDPKFAKPLENLKVGEVTNPIELDIGMEIIKVDERTKGTDEAFFDEAIVRSSMLQEKLPQARKKYMEKLIADAYVKIRSSYEPMVNPFLFPEEKKTASVKK